MTLPGVRVLPSLLAAALLAAGCARAQVAFHEGADGARRVSQTVRLLDLWEDGSSRGAKPLDVVTRVRSVAPGEDVVRVDVLLYGDWGAYLRSFEEDARRERGSERESVRTSLSALDVDADGLAELVLVTRRLQGALVLQENGEPEAGEPVRLAGYDVSVACLDRVDGALVEREIPADPASPAFAAVLAREHGGAVNAALQQAAGDHAFAKRDFEAAAYRYRAAREWAERSLSAAAMLRVEPGMPLPSLDPDDPVTLWLASRWRQSSLPPWWQRR